LIGVPLAEQMAEQNDQAQNRQWNDENGARDEGHRGGRRDDHDGQDVRHGQHGDDRDHGSDRGAGESGWRWASWNSDESGGRHDHRDGEINGRHGDGESQGWQSPQDQAPDGARTQSTPASHESVDAHGPIIGTPGEDELVGTVAGETLTGGAGNDLIIGGGGADILRGGAGDDTLVAKAGFAEIHGGAGFDAFTFDDSGVLDLSQLAGKVTGIEEVEITGTGNVELKLTFQDLLTMTDSGHQLTIVGDSGDKVSADLSGHSVAVADMGAFTRYVIDGGAATLDIDNNVQKNIIGI
jgi:Ca2+-binding RTX toxin-like protein